MHCLSLHFFLQIYFLNSPQPAITICLKIAVPFYMFTVSNLLFMKVPFQHFTKRSEIASANLLEQMHSTFLLQLKRCQFSCYGQLLQGEAVVMVSNFLSCSELVQVNYYEYTSNIFLKKDLPDEIFLTLIKYFSI